jgi:hypothetical protein
LSAILSPIDELHVVFERPTVADTDALEATELATVEALLVELAHRCLLGRAHLLDASESVVGTFALAFQI